MSRPHWWLETRGLRLRIWELGADPDAATGPPLVCLHGWLDQGLCWDRVAAALCERLPGRRIIAPDQRGFAASDRVGAGGWYHFPDYVADLQALADRALQDHPGIDRIDLAGHSMGGTVAGWFAGALPERVRRLAIVEGMGPMPPDEDSAIDRMRLFLDGLRSPRRVPRVRDLDHGAERLVARNPALSRDHALLLAEHGTEPTGDGDRRWSFDAQHLTRSPTPFREAWFGQALAEITAPTLVVWGEGSWYLPEVRERRVAMLTRTTVVEHTLPGGHMVPYEAPDALAGLLAAHLA